MRHNKRPRGNILGMTMAVVMLLVVIGAALAVVSTLNLNMAATQEYAQRADLLARAGINQFLEDMQNGLVNAEAAPSSPGGMAMGQSPAVSSPLQTILDDDFNMQVPNGPADPYATARQSALLDVNGPAYPLPDNHLGGQCYITFNHNRANLAWSTWNADESTPVAGYRARPVPAFSVDVVANAKVGSVTRRLAVHALRRWTYAVAANQQVYLSTPSVNPPSPLYPTRILGDVYSADPPAGKAVYVGYQWNCATCAPAQAESCTQVCGQVLATNPCPCSIVVSQGSSVQGEDAGYRHINIPILHDLHEDSTWTDLSRYTQAHPAPDGSYLVVAQPPVGDGGLQLVTGSMPDLLAKGPSGCGCNCVPSIPCPVGVSSPSPSPGSVPSASPSPSPGSVPSPSPSPASVTYYLRTSSPDKPLVLKNGHYFLNGSLTIEGTSKSGGLNLTDASLQVHGSLVFTARPTQVVGTRSAISVDQDFVLRWGFLQSDPQKGLVIKANRLVCQVGGDFRGLVVVQGGVFLSQLDLNHPQMGDAGGSVEVQLGSVPKGSLGSCSSTGCSPSCDVPVNQGRLPAGNCGCPLSQYKCSGATCPRGSPGMFGCGWMLPCGQIQTGGGQPPTVTPPNLNAVMPPGAPPGKNGVYPLNITGAVLSPATLPTPLVISSVAVSLDPLYLAPLNRMGPVTTRAWEVLP